MEPRWQALADIASTMSTAKIVPSRGGVDLDPKVPLANRRGGSAARQRRWSELRDPPRLRLVDPAGIRQDGQLGL